MKNWYIILDDAEVKCPLISVSAGSKLIILDYNGTPVKVRIHNFKDGYSEAKSGIQTHAYAISPRGRNTAKIIVVFK